MRYIATYLASSSWDLDALGILEPERASLYVKWNRLIVTRTDENGNEYEEEFEPDMYSADDTEFKVPYKEGME